MSNQMLEKLMIMMDNMSQEMHNMSQGQTEFRYIMEQKLDATKQELTQEIIQVRQELTNTVESRFNALKNDLNERISSCVCKVNNCEVQMEEAQSRLNTCENIVGQVQENLTQSGKTVQEHSNTISELVQHNEGIQNKITKNQGDITNLQLKVTENSQNIYYNEKKIREVKENFEANVERIFTENSKISNQLENFRDDVGRECLQKLEEKLSKIRGDGQGNIRSSVLTVDEVNTFGKTVPKFFGDDRGATPIQFITKCEKVFSYLRGSDDQQVELFITKLDGAALQWAMHKENEWKTFKEAKVAFLNKYWGIYVQDDFLQYLFSGKNRARDGPMAPYVQRLYLQSKFLNNPITDERFISHIVHHFYQQVQNYILGARTKSVEEVIALLETLDRRNEREEGLRGREPELPGRQRGPPRERFHPPDGMPREQVQRPHRQELQGNVRPQWEGQRPQQEHPTEERVRERQDRQRHDEQGNARNLNS
ncbi:uncharacterized protein LOC134527840 [Bacillus rossius redtenbacheri]|uniref:uncharacterized protein LOC134527840 n=1 Tax=Bacillus rossius redtenbacheri TaxID=93214 RepID=UPI002FDD18A9